MRSIKFLIAICALALLAGCGGYIYMGGASPSDGGDDGGGDGSVVFDAPVVTVDPDARATLLIEVPEDGADSWDAGIDDGDFGDITPDADCDDDGCEYDIPGLDPNAVYNVSVRYWKDGNLSQTTSVLVNTAFKELVAYGHLAEVNLGKSLDVGDYNGDGIWDIIAGHRDGAGAGRVEIFQGPFQSPIMPATILTSTNPNFFGTEVQFADMTGDGQDDVLINEWENPAGFGRVSVYDGAAIPAGESDEHALRTYSFRSDAAGSMGMGYDFVTMDDGTGRHDLIVGAPAYHPPGSIFFVDNSDFVFELDIGIAPPDYSMADCGAAPNNPALFIEDIGDVVLFNCDYTEVPPNRTTTLRFSDAPAADWATIATAFNADHEFTMGHLVGDDFFVSEGVDVGGGFVNIYTGHASNIPANILTSDTRDTFGVDAAVGDVYQAQPGLELLVGTDTHILVYFGYVEGAGLSDVTPDAILSIPGRNMHLVDVNGDGYLDIVSYGKDVDHGGFSRVGSVNVNR
jgi:hypothetical protein